MKHKLRATQDQHQSVAFTLICTGSLEKSTCRVIPLTTDWHGPAASGKKSVAGNILGLTMCGWLIEWGVVSLVVNVSPVVSALFKVNTGSVHLVLAQLVSATVQLAALGLPQTPE